MANLVYPSPFERDGVAALFLAQAKATDEAVARGHKVIAEITPSLFTQTSDGKFVPKNKIGENAFIADIQDNADEIIRAIPSAAGYEAAFVRNFFEEGQRYLSSDSPCQKRAILDAVALSLNTAANRGVLTQGYKRPRGFSPAS